MPRQNGGASCLCGAQVWGVGLASEVLASSAAPVMTMLGRLGLQGVLRGGVRPGPFVWFESLTTNGPPNTPRFRLGGRNDVVGVFRCSVPSTESGQLGVAAQDEKGRWNGGEKWLLGAIGGERFFAPTRWAPEVLRVAGTVGIDGLNGILG